MQSPINLLSLNRQALDGLMLEMGERPFRSGQLLKWIHQQGVLEIDAMTNLSKVLRSRLVESTHIAPPVVVTRQVSSDGVYKWLLRVDAVNCVETVFIPESGRGTLCVSSQVGCPLDCSFCATGKQGFNRNLGVAEIIGQLRVAIADLQSQGYSKDPITNVVFMGMGEPLLNLDNVLAAMDLMMDDFAYGLGRRRITVSTAGVVPGIERLKASTPVSLAVSLHAATDALRDQLVPINRKYPIASLMAALKRFSADDSSHITFEYVMLDGINDSPACAKQLAQLLRPLPAKINLIPFNPFPGVAYQCSPVAVIERFQEILMGHGLFTFTRKTRGDDIAAACGQLVGKVNSRSEKRRLATYAASGAAA